MGSAPSWTWCMSYVRGGVVIVKDVVLVKTVLLFISSVPMTVDLLTELSRGDFKIVSGTNVIVSDFIEADVVSSYSFSSVCVRRSGV